jgi:hypothetical protein
VQYIHHLRPGSHAIGRDSIQWVLVWTAPAVARGPVDFHITANASDDDNSELGDAIHARTLRVVHVR